MRPAAIILFLALALAGCGGDGSPERGGDAALADAGAMDAGAAMFHSAEGQYCSADPLDDPRYVCLSGMNLACAQTYVVPVIDEDAGAQPVYLCRVACVPGGACHVPGDVCCPAMIAAPGQPAVSGSVCAPSELCRIVVDAGAGD